MAISLFPSKRCYHPLVVFFYYADMLSSEQLNQIPKTTIDYWKAQNHAALFGYEWVSSFFDGHEEFNKIQKHKIIFKSMRLCLRLFDTFSVMTSGIKGYKRVLKNNIPVIINTIDYLSSEIPFEKVCSVFNISTQQFYRFKNKVKCTGSVLNLCFKTHPSQMTIAEASAIRERVNDPANERKKLATIWYQLMRDGILFCSASTFYKYVGLVSERIKRIAYSKPKKLLISTRPFQYIHVDTTFLPTIKDGSVRAVIIKDNYSKKILHKGIAENGESKWISMLLKEMFDFYKLDKAPELTTLVCDGGSENKGNVDDWIESLDQHTMVKKTARTELFEYTNNEVESVFNIFKHEFLNDRIIADKVHALQLLGEFQTYNDNQRYPIALYGITPQEAFDGTPIDKHRFKMKIKEAAKLRYLKNKAGKFCDVCSQG